MYIGYEYYACAVIILNENYDDEKQNIEYMSYIHSMVHTHRACIVIART